MKLLSIAIPCYNSQDYMEHCIQTLLTGKDEVEILVVNDGSSDRTKEIADRYAQEYPDIVRAIHQENGGHGEAVNAGLRNATGIFYKVVDSDDWVDEDSYQKVLATLRQIVLDQDKLDMLLCNFVYENKDFKRKKVMHYRKIFPVDQIFTWDDVQTFPIGHYILMHSIIYRTQLLKNFHFELPKHTFYVDSLFAYCPLPHVKHMYYLDTNFYRYYIGREDQSVNENIMIGRIDQQIYVTQLAINAFDVSKLPQKYLRKYAYQNLEILMTISSVLLLRSGTDENFQKKQELWQYLKLHQPKVYHKIRYGFLGISCNWPGKAGRKISIKIYQLIRRIYGC
ncbi:glycosyl transferase [Clostridia bacterium]|nr:glycosyl transferase [Clostridia bacterium]